MQAVTWSPSSCEVCSMMSRCSPGTCGLQHDMRKRSAVILSASRRGALGAKKHVLLAEVGASAAVPAGRGCLDVACLQDIAKW